MLSRRSVRIKIMQVLYGAAVSQTPLTTALAERNYRRSVNDTYRAFLYSMLQLARIVNYTGRNMVHRSHKMLKTADDEAFDGRFLHNAVSQNLCNNAAFEGLLRQEQLQHLGDLDLVRKHYQDFIKTPAFVAYNALDTAALTPAHHQKILSDLYKFLLADEVFVDALEDQFPNWDDDKSLIVGAVKRAIKLLPEDTAFYQKFAPDEEAVGEFGSELLYKIVHFDSEMTERINQKFENWDPDRITPIDRILIQQSLGELLYCPNIPAKVTIDEYIEIAKLYSTDKSKEFVNGVVDQLMRDLSAEGNLVKIGRGTV